MTRKPAGAPSPLRRLAVGATAAIATFGFILILAIGSALLTYNGPGPEAKGETTIVFLRPGAGLSEIGATLEREGAVRSAAVFSAAATLTGAARELKAGEYEFASRASMSQVLGKIRRGEVVRRSVTIPEGVTSAMVVEILNAQPALTGDVPVPPEGSVLPETYEIQRGEERSAVLARMMDARDELLTKLWAQRQPGLPYETPEEAVIMASIIEKETSVPAERPMIARVFVNRLQQGMRLQTDPTIIYGLTKGRPLGRGILKSERDTPTAYNTYTIDGLPPTPIANPGRESLAAALSPPPGDQLYFVADGTGGHAFSKTYDEHEVHVGRLRQRERAQAAGQAAGKAK